MKCNTCFVRCAALFLLSVPVLGDGSHSSSESDRQERLRGISEMTFALTMERLAIATNTDEKCAILSAALAQEIREPAMARKYNSYLAQSEVAQMKYIEMLASFGTNAVPHLRAVSACVPQQSADLLFLALAMAGDTEARTRVSHLLQEGKGLFIRLMAIRAVDTRDKESALPLLKAALSDSSCVEASDCGGSYRIYPIREEAYRALTRFGVRVDRAGDRFSVRH